MEGALVTPPHLLKLDTTHLQILNLVFARFHQFSSVLDLTGIPTLSSPSMRTTTFRCRFDLRSNPLADLCGSWLSDMIIHSAIIPSLRETGSLGCFPRDLVNLWVCLYPRFSATVRLRGHGFPLQRGLSISVPFPFISHFLHKKNSARPPSTNSLPGSSKHKFSL